MVNITKIKRGLITTINSVTLTEGKLASITGITDFDEEVF